MRSIHPHRTLFSLFLPAFGLAVGAMPADAHAQPADTRTITDRYVELTFQRRHDELRDLYAQDAVFYTGAS